MTLGEIRKQLHAVIIRIPEFSKSNRGEWLYNAKDDVGDKVKVQFKGNNFIVMVGKLNVKITSKPLRTLDINAVEPYLRKILIRHTRK